MDPPAMSAANLEPARSGKGPSQAQSQFNEQKKAKRSTSSTGSWTAFCVFATANLIAAAFAPIQDCDEVFNYWEPTHYLSHGYGLQTWEYSPEYSIRSWFYVAIHAAIGRVGYLFTSSKIFEFYWIRIALGFACAYCQTRLFSTVSKAVNPRAAVMLMIVMVSSPGMFHASTAFLPSSFSMYASMLGAAEFIDWRGGSGTSMGIVWFGIGGIIGWPFAAALVVPFLFQEVTMSLITKDAVEVVRRVADGTVKSLVIMILQMFVEAFFYRKWVVVPWNIVAYNVFSGAGKGPDIFGTEPANFYVRNLMLNFNVWALLALWSGPILGLHYILNANTKASYGLVRNTVFVTPFYMWLGIFTLQPHKEERFMYPAYPFLALNAAISLHTILGWIGTSDPRQLIGKIPAKLKLAVVGLAMLLAFNVGVLRTVAMVTAYRAPLQIYSPLGTQPDIGPHTNLCLGKEWYRFPSSFFLPNGIHAKFIKSEFNGLLPGKFSEAGTGFGLYPGTWLVPSGMNDQNIADPSKYVEIKHCEFLVDSSFPSVATSELEPDYAKDTTAWEAVHCEKFLDAAGTGILGRLLWLPDHPLVPGIFQRRWGDYCLLRRRKP